MEMPQKKKEEETEVASVGLANAKENGMESAVTAEPDDIFTSK